ncbi:DUF397 domain-containing protein [Streptomyces sp. NPDC050388]|uniref:DUF397 domain-containing protein n=1 Tax=Streptomyces sp. NPDC050388 TaxID=3155781 RepID=UPI003426A78D
MTPCCPHRSDRAVSPTRRRGPDLGEKPLVHIRSAAPYSGVGAAYPRISRTGGRPTWNPTPRLTPVTSTAGLPHPGWRRSVGGSWAWRKSSASDGAEGTCVEVAWTGQAVLVRHSTRPHGSVLAVRAEAWHRFLGLVKSSEPSAPSS